MLRTFLVLALAALSPAAAFGQHPQTRQGFGISFGFGAGSATYTCGGCSDWGGTGASGYLRLGGYVNPSLFLAGESSGWIGDNIFEEQSIGSVMAVAQWYPMVATGLYLKGGLGYAYSSMTDGGLDLSTSGFGASLGAGYDWRVARNFALTPYINYMKMFGGSTSAFGGDTTLDVGVFQFGLGFTWF